MRAAILNGDFTVDKVESKPQKRNPYPPFTTSTLQQDASRKLGFSSSRTMQVAQKLYEGFEIDGETQGLITYMRTDGVQIAKEAIDACRDVISAIMAAIIFPMRRGSTRPRPRTPRKPMKQSARSVWRAIPRRPAVSR